MNLSNRLFDLLPRYLWVEKQDGPKIVKIENKIISFKATLTPYTRIENLIHVNELRTSDYMTIPTEGYFEAECPLLAMYMQAPQLANMDYFVPVFYFARARAGPFVNGEVIPILDNLLSKKVSEIAFDPNIRPLEEWFVQVYGRKPAQLKIPLPSSLPLGSTYRGA